MHATNTFICWLDGDAMINAPICTSGAAVTIWPRGDDEPQDDGRGVREPRRPSPVAPSTGDAMTEEADRG